MSQINVSKKDDVDKRMVFEVEVKDVGSATFHTVSLEDKYHKKLTGGNISPEELLRRSFVFLLERESKESILSEFDLKEIARYFPDYERTINK